MFAGAEANSLHRCRQQIYDGEPNNSNILNQIQIQQTIRYIFLEISTRELQRTLGQLPHRP